MFLVLLFFVIKLEYVIQFRSIYTFAISKLYNLTKLSHWEIALGNNTLRQRVSKKFMHALQNGFKIE